MRQLDIIRQKRRFEMFSEKTKDKVLELNSFFGKYNMHFQDRIKKTFTYYDTPDLDLQKSNIVLFKTQIGNFTELNMATEKINASYRYTLRTNYRHFTKPIKPHDNILKHKDFLIENFKSMFLSSVNLDPEFLMRKLQVAYTIQTNSMEYRSANVTGLKITYSFDKDIYTNNFNKQKASANIMTIYQHSAENTNADLEDLLSKLTRYLKELTPIVDTKIQIARKMTSVKPLTEKEKKTIAMQNKKKK